MAFISAEVEYPVVDVMESSSTMSSNPDERDTYRSHPSLCISMMESCSAATAIEEIKLEFKPVLPSDFKYLKSARADPNFLTAELRT